MYMLFIYNWNFEIFLLSFVIKSKNMTIIIVLLTPYFSINILLYIYVKTNQKHSQLIQIMLDLNLLLTNSMKVFYVYVPNVCLVHYYW